MREELPGKNDNALHRSMRLPRGKRDHASKRLLGAYAGDTSRHSLCGLLLGHSDGACLPLGFEESAKSSEEASASGKKTQGQFVSLLHGFRA